MHEALTYANRSIQEEDRPDNETTKAKVLRALSREAEAAAAERRSKELERAKTLPGT